MAFEYRVRWERDGRQPSYRIYQSWESACRKVRSIQAMDTLRHEFPHLSDMRPLVSVELQVREVGGWGRHDYRPKVNPSTVEGVRDHVRYNAPEPTEKPEGWVPF